MKISDYPVPAKPKVAILMGSDSDLSIMAKAADFLTEFGVEFEIKVISAHRTPHDLVEFIDQAHTKGVKVIIAGAGGAAHLSGVIAAQTYLPVIGIPISNSLDGMDALLSIVQMPSGVPVATVGVDRAKNAAVLAVQILAIADENLTNQLKKYKAEMAAASRAKNN